MAIRGVTYNDEGTAGEKTPALFRADMDVRYPLRAEVAFGDQAGTYCEGDDSRLSDQRIPVDNSVTSAKMGDGAVGVAELSATGTPGTTTFLRGDNAWAVPVPANQSITNAMMADDAVGIDELSATGTPGSTTVLRGDNTWATVGSTIPNDTITNAMMADDAIGIAELSATGTPSDTTFLRGDNTWTSGTVAVGDNTISTAKIVDDAVTVDKIADDAVGVAQLSATGTPGTTTFLRGDNTWTVIPPTPYDVYYVAFGGGSTRIASSYGDNALGIKVQRAVTMTSVTYRCGTADASGNLVVELRKNGSQVTGSDKTIAAADQTAGGANATATGSWSFAAGDILTVYVTGVGTTPGTGLVADITGTAS